MKNLTLLLIIILNTTILFAQKPLLDQSAITSWQRIGNEQISNDGKYVAYSVSSDQSGTSFSISSTDNKFKKIISGGVEV